MNYLFIHQHFPGQYAHVARYLAEAGHHVVFITQRCKRPIGGVRTITYPPAPAHSHTHPYLREFDAGVANGIAVADCCEALQRGGFTPDLVVGHNGWGELLYVKDVWPSVPLLGYFEFFYRNSGSDVGFDPEFPAAPDDPMRLRTRNAVNLLGLDAADWGQTPTEWQRQQYPRRYWSRISIAHEGVDTGVVRPARAARIWLEGGLSLSHDDEVVTCAGRARHEPMRREARATVLCRYDLKTVCLPRHLKLFDKLTRTPSAAPGRERAPILPTHRQPSSRDEPSASYL